MKTEIKVSLDLHTYIDDEGNIKHDLYDNPYSFEPNCTDVVDFESIITEYVDDHVACGKSVHINEEDYEMVKKSLQKFCDNVISCVNDGIEDLNTLRENNK